MGVNYKKALLKKARDYYISLMPSWKDAYFDKLSARDVKGKTDEQLRAMIIRFTIRWAIEDYSIIFKADREGIDRLFRDIYYQICGQHCGSDEFADKFECVSEFRKSDDQIFL